MSKQRTAKLVTFGRGGDTVYLGGGCTCTGYGKPDNPHAAKPDDGPDGYDFPDGCPAIDSTVVEFGKAASVSIGGQCVGHYLDYGPDHYRIPHEYCHGACECRESQPGNVHTVRFRREPKPYPEGCGRAFDIQACYFPTVAEAKTWIDAYHPIEGDPT